MWAEGGAGAGPVLEPQEGLSIPTRPAQGPEAETAPQEGEVGTAEPGARRPRLSQEEAAASVKRGGGGSNAPATARSSVPHTWARQACA